MPKRAPADCTHELCSLVLPLGMCGLPARRDVPVAEGCLCGKAGAAPGQARRVPSGSGSFRQPLRPVSRPSR